MESCDPEEQITLTGRDYCNPISEVFISNSNLTSFHTDNADFEMQIQEVDSEISKFDKCEAHVEILQLLHHRFHQSVRSN